MQHLPRWIVPVIAISFGITACVDPTDPPAGTPGEVVIRAYVDADGSGDFSSGDSVISGATVTLTPTEGGEELSATTDSEGVARFDAVPPRGYVASLDGSVPSGAVTSGPERPVVVVPFQGGTVEAEFRFVFNPGALEGVVFRDDNDNEVYDPGADRPAGGAEILAFAGTSIAGEPVATATTGSDGEFSLSPLRPGTYSVLVRLPPPLEHAGDSVHVMEIAAAETTEMYPQFVGDFLMPIADARAVALESQVTIQGVVLADQGTYDFQDRDTYIEDPTAGIRLFGLDPALGLVVGDSVQVTGTLEAFNDELQMTVAEIEVLGVATTPTARPVTGAQINAFEAEGELRITGPVTVQSVASFSFDAHSVTVVDAEGTEFVIRVDSPNEIPTDYWQQGGVYVVRGVVARFRGTGQIKPRGFDDVEEVSTIAEARLAADDDVVLVEGVVVADQGTYDFQNRDTYIQDATGGVRIFGLDPELALQAGDSVRVGGTMDSFNDERQITVAGVEVLGTGTIPDPRPVTGAEINSFLFDGQLAITGAVTVVEVQGFSFDAHNVTVEDATGTQFVIRVDSPNEIETDYWQVGASYRVTGVLARFRSTAQIKPRGLGDVEEL